MIRPTHVSDSTVTPIIHAILNRRSVRSGFSERRIPREHLEAVLACGLSAPSSKNAQPWRFHVFDDHATRTALADAAVNSPERETWVPNDPRTGRPHEHWPSSVVESADALRAASSAILIENRGVFTGGGKRTLVDAAPDALATSLQGYAFECIGIGAALENMWLAANSLDIAVAFLGDLVIAEAAAREMFTLEGDMIGVIALGYSDLVPHPRRPSPAATQTDTPVIWHDADDNDEECHDRSDA